MTKLIVECVKLKEYKKKPMGWRLGLVLWLLGLMMMIVGVKLIFASPYDELRSVRVVGVDEGVKLVDDRMTYKYFQYPQWIVSAWREGYGDCSDMNGVLAYILENNGYDAYLVGGHATCEGERVKHEWLIVDDEVVDVLDCTDYKKRFGGYW